MKPPTLSATLWKTLIPGKKSTGHSPLDRTQDFWCCEYNACRREVLFGGNFGLMTSDWRQRPDEKLKA